MLYCICHDCGAEIEDAGEELYLDDGALVCENCIRVSIGLKPTPGPNYTLAEIVDALTIEHHPAAVWARLRASESQAQAAAHKESAYADI